MKVFANKYRFQIIAIGIHLLAFLIIKNVYLIKPAKELVVFKTRIITKKVEKQIIPEKKEIKPMEEAFKFAKTAGKVQPRVDIKTPTATEQVKLDKMVKAPTISTPTTIKEPEKKTLVQMEKMSKSKDLFVTKTGPVTVGEFYAARTSEVERGSAVSEYGGSYTTEKAVFNALEYLHDSQEVNGSWGMPYPVGITGLALMAFIGSGYTDNYPKAHKYNKTVKKAITFLIRNEKNGKFSDRIYESAASIMALTEAYIMTKKSSLKPLIERGLRYLLTLQRTSKQVKDDIGGWQGYHGFSSILPSAWALMALESVKNAGIEVSQSAINDAISFIKNCEVEKGGFADWTQQGCEKYAEDQENWWKERNYKSYECEGCNAYYGPLGSYSYEELSKLGSVDKKLIEKYKPKKHTHLYSKHSTKRTADPMSTGLGALCLMFVGERDSDEVKDAIKMIRRNWMPGSGSVDYVRWYYTGQAMFHYSRDDWNAWNNTMREVLPKMQNSKGSFTSNNAEEIAAGVSYNTTMAILSLEIYYRYAPIYKK